MNKPSLIRNGCHTIIDNIFTNVLNKDLSRGVIIDDKGDHFPIFLINFVLKNKKISK